MERAFANRTDAGRLLAEKLEKYTGRDDIIVLGLPRGGVPVAYEVAKRLRVPLDVFIVRKLGVPGFEELAAGAIASGGAAACARRVSGSRSVMRVSAVGERQFTVTPYLAIASAVERVRPTIPSLAAE